MSSVSQLKQKIANLKHMLKIATTGRSGAVTPPDVDHDFVSENGFTLEQVASTTIKVMVTSGFDQPPPEDVATYRRMVDGLKQQLEAETRRFKRLFSLHSLVEDMASFAEFGPYVRSQLEQKADPRAVDSDGRTPLQILAANPIVSEQDRLRMMELLKSVAS
jgi:hypothetical protein